MDSTSCLSEQQMKGSCRMQDHHIQREQTTWLENLLLGFLLFLPCGMVQAGTAGLRHSYLTSKAKSLASLNCLLKVVKQRTSNYSTNSAKAKVQTQVSLPKTYIFILATVQKL